jgi:imidazolonepropionase-like amidohydrolase
MATSGNATLMGLGEKTGRVDAGLEADLVFLRADPSEDVRNVREVELVVTNGEAHRFDDLVATALSALE